MSEELSKSWYSISEAAAILNEAPSLIRFWEKSFPQLKPRRNEKGTRKYSQKDIETLQLIHHLIKTKGMTIEGARQLMRHQPSTDLQANVLARLKEIRSFLVALKSQLEK